MGDGLGALYTARYPIEMKSLILVAPTCLMKIPMMPLVRSPCSISHSEWEIEESRDRLARGGNFYDNVTFGENLNQLNAVVL